MTKAPTPLLVLLGVLLSMMAPASATGGTRSAAEEPYAYPGIMVAIDGRSGSCTLAFLGKVAATTPEEADRFFALTAGHCFFGGPDEAFWEPGQGPLVSAIAPANKPLGRAVYAVDRAPVLPLDVALIELDDVPFDPSVCFFGGPVATDTSRRTGRETVSYVGTGLLLHSRRGITDDLRNDVVLVQGPVSQGDSGGPVMSEDGRALGIISSVGVDSADGAGMQVIRLDTMLTHIKTKTGLDVQILTAPLSGKQWPADALAAAPECSVS